MDRAEVLLEHKSLVTRFFNYFDSNGYHPVPSEPLIPRTDRSLLFSNATVVPLKPYLTGQADIPPRGLMVLQQCLRTQNLGSIKETEARLEYLSLFSMLGVMAAPDQGATMLDLALKYLISCESIDPARICIYFSDGSDLPSEQASCIRSLYGELNSRPPSFYHWTYGLPGIYGAGITFALKGPDGAYYDIGNLVEVRNSDSVLGYEFGFGVETFLARKMGVIAPLKLSLINTPIETNGVRDERVRDCLAACLAMLNAGVVPGSGRQSSVLRKSLRLCVGQIREMDCARSSLSTWIIEYSESVGYSQCLISQLQEYLRRYEIRINGSLN